MTNRNRIGTLFSVTTFGESHGAAIGGVVDGVPSGVALDIQAIQTQLNRRRPGQSAITTARNESDTVWLLSGLLDGITTGAPIGFVIENNNHRSADYDDLKDVFRPGHADYTYYKKYGIRDHRGGGRSSARETAARVAAGAIAQQILTKIGVKVVAFTSQVHDVCMEGNYLDHDLTTIDDTPVRCPDKRAASLMEAAILEAKNSGDTLGGIVTCVATGVPPGLGEPVFGKLSAKLAEAMMSINAAKGFEVGRGFDFVNCRGSEVVDNFVCRNGEVTTTANNSGGIQGGISNGQDIVMRVAFKPVATLLREVASIDKYGRPVTLNARGRHDPCVVPRAVPVVEAMAAIVLLDNYLLNKATKL